MCTRELLHVQVAVYTVAMAACDPRRTYAVLFPLPLVCVFLQVVVAATGVIAAMMTGTATVTARLAAAVAAVAAAAPHGVTGAIAALAAAAGGTTSHKQFPQHNRSWQARLQR
jgi:hypothetical protein